MSTRVLNYAIEKLRYAKDDNEKIAALFLVLKSDPRQYLEDNNLENLYIAISPAFLYRLLKGCKSETKVNTEELALGIQILSFFAMSETIMKRSEIVPMIECIFLACSTPEIKDSKILTETICQIIASAFRIDSIRNMVIQKQLLPNFIDLLETAEDDECKLIVSNCCSLINSEHDSKKLFSLFLHVTELSTFLAGSKKLMIYDLILKLLQYFSQLKKFPSVIQEFSQPSNIKHLVNYISHFFLFSSGFKPKIIILLAHGLHLFSMDIFASTLENLSHVDLFLNLCMVEIRLFVHSLLIDKTKLNTSNDMIESCFYILESFIRSIEENDITLTKDNKIFNSFVELINTMNEFIADCSPQDFQFDNSKGIYKLLSIILGCDSFDPSSSDISSYIKCFSQLASSSYFPRQDVILWSSPVLIRICNDDKYKSDFMMDDIANFLSSCLTEVLTFMAENSYQMESKLPEHSPTLLFLISKLLESNIFDEMKWNEDVKNHFDLIVKCCNLLNIETHAHLVGMLLLCGTVIIQKFVVILSQKRLTSWMILVSQKCTTQLLDRVENMIHILKPFTLVCEEWHQTPDCQQNIQILRHFKMQFLKTKMCTNNKDEIIYELINTLERITF